MSQRTATEKLFGTTTLDERQAALAKKTYALLTLSVGMAIYGGYLGATTPGITRFFASGFGWLLAIVLLNVIPRIALWAAEKDITIAMGVLAADGFISGLVMAPMLWLAQRLSPEIVPAALGVTAAVFAGVTGYVMITKQRFSAPVGLLTGLFVSILAATALNMFLHIGLLGILIAVGIGVLGVFMLIYATSDVLNNPDYNSPVQGALMLFAAIFNIFVSVLNILMRLYRSR